MQSASVRAAQPQSADDREFWVVSKVPEGFRVYQAGNPQQVYLVTGTPEKPFCDCGLISGPYQQNARCVHVDAVFGSQEGRTVTAAEEIEGGDQAPEIGDPDEPFAGDLPTHLVLKRSVSPDGRIDSLSVELALRCDIGEPQSVLDDAVYALGIQDDIVQRFLKHERRSGNGQTANVPVDSRNRDGNGRGVRLGEPVPARLTTIDGMQTRMGWSYYINVEVDGQVVRLFGDRRKIQDYIRDAGYENSRQARNIGKGARLDIPCQVILGQGNNGKYLTVEEVMPATTPQQRYGNRRGER